MFLKRVHELLLGEHGFYDDIFHALGMPYEAVKWRPDVNPIDREEAMLHKQMQVAKLIRVHRVRGHLIADLDPLRWKEPHTPVELDPATYGLTIWDLDREFLTDGVARSRPRCGSATCSACCATPTAARSASSTCTSRTPTSSAGSRARSRAPSRRSPKEQKDRILERLNAAEAFEKFLATKYVGTKRFGIEGAESAIPILDEILSGAADAGLDSCVIGMAHRGRLNVLSNIMGKSYEAIFSEFEGHVDPTTVQGSGDVKYHLGATGKYVSPSGADIRVELAANPSHLETVDPIVMGMVRADPGPDRPARLVPGAPDADPRRRRVRRPGHRRRVPGDERHRRLPGRRHDPPHHQQPDRLHDRTRSSRRSSIYCSDVAKTVQAPIFHVNGDDPEACVRVARLALDYRQTFHKDVVIDMVCYRRHGHNEGDDPSYTQPLMYKAIAERRSVRKLYVETLVKRGDITVDEAEQALADFQGKLQVALDETRAQRDRRRSRPPSRPSRSVCCRTSPRVSTVAVLDRIFAQLTDYPQGFTVHPKLAKQFEGARELYDDEGEVDWATAESLAIGSLVLEGHPVRLAGEDSRRGTFSQRHAALVDYETGEPWIPLDRPRRAPRPASGCTTRCCRSTPRSGSSTATRTPTPTRS